MKTQRHALVAVIAALTLGSSATSAQETPTSYRACYVPQVGAMYLLDLPGLPTACLSTDHREISWTEGGTTMADGSVTAAKLAVGSVTAEKLAVGAVTQAKVAPDAVGSQALADEAVTGEKIASAAVDNRHLAAGSVRAAQVRERAIISSHIARGNVYIEHMARGSIDSVAVRQNSIGHQDLAPGSVRSNEIVDGTIQAVDLASGAVTLERIVVEGTWVGGISGETASERLACPRGFVTSGFGWAPPSIVSDPQDRFVIQQSYPIGEREWFVQILVTGNTAAGIFPRLVCMRITP